MGAIIIAIIANIGTNINPRTAANIAAAIIMAAIGIIKNNENKFVVKSKEPSKNKSKKISTKSNEDDFFTDIGITYSFRLTLKNKISITNFNFQKIDTFHS